MQITPQKRVRNIIRDNTNVSTQKTYGPIAVHCSNKKIKENTNNTQYIQDNGQYWYSEKHTQRIADTYNNKKSLSKIYNSEH